MLWSKGIETSDYDNAIAGRPEDEILQLTQLLCMGRKNEALEDLLGSSEHTSERVGAWSE